MMARPGHILLYGLRTVWVLLCNIVCIPSYLCWLFTFLPVYLYSPRMFWQVEEILFSWMASVVTCWLWSAGYSVVESGESLDKLTTKKLVILPNHQSHTDSWMLMSSFSARQGLVSKVMLISNLWLKYTNVGIISWMHDDFFIRSGKAFRELSLVEFKDHLINVFVRKQRQFLFLYPEGGFLRNRKAASQEFAKKQDLPRLEHVLLPRIGALDVVMKVLGPDTDLAEEDKIQRIVDVTIAYPEGKPLDIPTVVLGWRNPCKTHLHFRSWDVKDLPKNSEELFDWMVKLYQEKEQMLEEYYKTGEFPCRMFEDSSRPVVQPTAVHQDPLRLVTIQMLFLVSGVMFTRLALCLGTALTSVLNLSQ